MFILGDIVSFPNASLIRGRCRRHLNSQGEFDVGRHDGTYKMLMSLSGQPNHGAEIRCADGGIREGSRGRGGDKSRTHVAHKLTTASGAEIASAVEYSEGRAITSDFIRRILLEDPEGDSYLRQVRILYTDRARDFDHGDYWAFLPGLLAIARDPLHRCIEVE